MFYGSLCSGDMDDSALLRMEFHLPLFFRSIPMMTGLAGVVLHLLGS